MLNNAPPQKCSNTAYILCFIIVIIVIILVLIYMTNNQTKSSSETEGYFLAVGPHASTSDGDGLMSMGGIATNQRISKPFKQLVKESKTQTVVEDGTNIGRAQHNIDKMVENNKTVSKLIAKSQSGEMLTKDEMKKLAMINHEAEINHEPIISKKICGVEKMMIVNGTVPVLDTDGKNVDTLGETSRGTNKLLYVASAVNRVPYYAINKSDLWENVSTIKDFEHFDTEHRIVNAFDSPEEKSKIISDTLLKSPNGRALSEAYAASGKHKQPQDKYFVNKNQMLVK